jgi:hypothetical protein
MGSWMMGCRCVEILMLMVAGFWAMVGLMGWILGSGRVTVVELWYLLLILLIVFLV